MPAHNTYLFTWVSLTLDVGYLFTAAPAKRSHCSLAWARGYLLTATPPDLDRGVAPLGPPAPAQPWLLGRGVAPLCRHPWPQAWVSSSWPPHAIAAWHSQHFLSLESINTIQNYPRPIRILLSCVIL